MDNKEVVYKLHLVERGLRSQHDRMMVLICEGRIQLIDVNLAYLGVQVEEDHLVIDCC